MVIGEALGGGTTSDVFVSLTTTRTWAFRVTSGLGDGEHDTVLSVLVESPRHIAPMDLATAVQHAATRLGSSSTSIQSAKKRVVRRLQLRLATPVSRAMTLADFELFEGDGRLAMKLIDKVQAVTADDVARVVQAHLSADRASMVECFPAPILLTAAEEAARVAQEKRTAAQTKDAAEDRPRQGGKKKIASPKPRRKR
jgi:predicted Zn-dependent peptidase